MKKLTSVFICLLLVIPSQAGTIYVDAGAAGANNGSSWSDAYNYLQDGLTIAVANDQVWVAQGTYKPDANTSNPTGTSDRTAAFHLKNNVSIYGGFPTGGGSRDPNTYVTFLSGDINVPDNNSDNSCHVVTGSGTDSTAVLDGFTITAGNANITSYPDYVGGGMLNLSANCTVSNCTFRGNLGYYGCGMFNDGSSPAVTNCTFSENSAEHSGGGIYNYSDSKPVLTDCIFSGNSAVYDGGGMLNNSSSPTLTGCTFSGNSAEAGSGMLNYDNNPTLTSCIFSGNSASYYGGGMFNNQSSPTLTNCTFNSNDANTEGGGMFNGYYSSPTLTSCIFSRNSALSGGGIFSYYNSSPTLTNCTFVSNNAGNGNAVSCDSEEQAFPSFLRLSNSILWDGGNEIENNDGSTIIITYSDIQGGWSGLGNIDIDPCFVNADTNDYHLKSEGWRWDTRRKVWTWDDVTSRCIDAGNPASPLGDELLFVPDDPNNEWGQNLRIDIGAFGGTAEASIPPYDWALLADLTNDGIVDLEDYAYQAADWLMIRPDYWFDPFNWQPGDLNHDNLVDASDLAFLIEDWLEQTSWH